MAASFERTSLALAACLTLGLCAPSAGAQDAPLDRVEAAHEAELDAAADQARVATALYVSGAVLAGGGLVTLIGGSIATLSCGPSADCDAAAIAIAVGGIAAGVGLVLFIVATFIDQGASERRRRVLREQMAFDLAPLPGGAALTASIRF
ncbi:MAG: hypothetical protein H6719_09550 [Sandaracinaceae bacterium]|nr:hypothetical protein [Sandaracinaceae bacterium]